MPPRDDAVVSEREGEEAIERRGEGGCARIRAVEEEVSFGIVPRCSGLGVDSSSG